MLVGLNCFSIISMIIQNNQKRGQVNEERKVYISYSNNRSGPTDSF